MPQRNDSSRSTPTTSPKNNSWFRMQAGHQSDADIYIYDEIGFWGVTAKQFISDLNALGDITHINLHINSPGGDVFEGIAIFNALKTHGASITVYVDGVAASMASVIAMVGNPVIMPENTFMMIHKPFGFTGGDAEDMRTYADLLDKVEAVLLPAYAQKTGKTTDEIAAMLADETWMSGAECLAHGFADQVTPAVKAMACIQSKRTEEFKKMPESIRNMITPPRNSAPRVQDDEPAASRTPVQAAAPVVDENSIRAQVLAEQKARVNGINDLFAMFGGRYQTLQAQCLADPECSLEQAREKLLNEMGRESTPSNKNTPAHIYAGNGNFVGDGIRQALMARAGFEKTERDNVYNGMTLREYARMSLTERGIGVSSYNPMQMVGAAFTHSTSDFGNILLDVANKAILQGWEDAPETYEQWTRKGQLSDFKIAHRVGMGGFSALRQVREGAEYKYVTTGDKQATIALATYGELFSITRQAIINDDLNMLTDVPMKLGRAAKSTIADLVYAILTSNPKISTDNVSLFDKAKHANVLESAAMDVASLDKARQLMRVQKEGERHLNIRPAFVLVPTAMESVANQVIRSSSVKGADINAGIINPVKDFATVIAEPRLDDNSQTTFYLAASKGSDTIEVAYLNGVDTPYIDQMEGFSVDGVTTKVRIDAGMGDQQRQRYQVQLSLRQKYQQQLEQLRRDSEQKGTYNTDDYRKAEQALTESLNRQLNENRRYWQQLEIAQGDWKNGVLRALQNVTENADNTAGTVEQLFTSAFSSMSDWLAAFCTTGKLNFKSFTSSVLSDMSRIMAQIALMKAVKGIASALPFDFVANADGGVYQSADLSRYSGTVVNRPTFFAFAKGAGVMGEAGPEAILPLRRGTDGKLGVVADIGGSGMAMFAPQYNIEINNDGTNGQIGPAALKVVYDLGKKAAADFMQQQARDGGRLSGAYR